MNTLNIPTAAPDGSNEMHSDGTPQEVARIVLTEFPPGEQFFKYRPPFEVAGHAVEWVITRSMDTSRARRVMAAALTLIEEAGDEPSVDEIIVAVAGRIALRRLAEVRGG